MIVMFTIHLFWIVLYLVRSEYTCNYGGYTCSVDLTEWNSSNSNAYNCSNIVPYNISFVATKTAIRRNVINLNDTEKHILLKAFTCSIYNKNVTRHNFETNPNWIYVGTSHGEPGWYPQCQKDDTRRGLNSPGCCYHSNPNFVAWHRILMVQYDNALLQWDLNAFSPYLNWIDFIGNDLPDLLSKPSIKDPILNISVQNPFFNYRLPDTIYNQIDPKQAKCQYTCRNPKPALYEYSNSSRSGVQDSWYRQILQSYFYDYFVPFNYMFEIPHNNIHNLLGGNMPNLWTVMGDPVFMFHHSEVERLFLIWQKVMKLRGIDYTDPNKRCKYMGCFISWFEMEDPIVPFWNDKTYRYNADPIGSTFSESSIKALEYEGMYYEYDTLEFNGLSLAELNNTLHKFHSHRFIFLGFNFNYLQYAYTVNYNISRLGHNDVVKSGFFTILGNQANSWEGIPKYLYRVDITDALIEYGLNEDNFENELFDVQISIETGHNDIEYSITETGVFHPFIIYRDGRSGTEIHSLIWSDDAANEMYNYQNTSFILGTDHHYKNHSVRLVYPAISSANDISSATQISYYDKNDADSLLFIQPVQLAQIYSDAVYGHKNYTFTQLNYYTGNIEYGDVSTTICQDCLYAFGRNRLMQQLTSNTINVYPNQDAWQGYSSYDMFNDLSFPTSLSISLETDAAIEQGHLVIPWNKVYRKTNLYDTTYRHSTDLASIKFQNCPNDDTNVCQVNSKELYDSCNTQTNGTLVCGVNIYANLNFNKADQTYYFISENDTLCHDGFKVSVHVDDPTINSCTPYSLNESIIAYADTVLDEDGTKTIYNITIQIDPEPDTQVQGLNASARGSILKLTLTGPETYTWFSWGLFGPWNANGGGMKGVAAVHTSSSPNNVDFYYLKGNGIHPKTSLMACNEILIEDGNTEKTCTTNMCQEYLQYTNISTIKTNEPYYGRFAYNKNGAPGFSTKHGKSPLVFEYIFKTRETIIKSTEYYTSSTTTSGGTTNDNVDGGETIFVDTYSMISMMVLILYYLSIVI